MKFFNIAIKDMKVSGSIAPSSKYLINNCLKGVDFEKSKVILELGVGDGCFTEIILERLNLDCKLIALEINDKFYDMSVNKFSGNKQLELHHHSAIDFDEILKKASIEKVDYIISSLPLSLFAQEDVDSLFEKIPKYLSKEGAFVQYQYSYGKYGYFKKVFDKVKVDFTILNAPPALVFTCKNL